MTRPSASARALARTRALRDADGSLLQTGYREAFRLLVERPK
jgi:hypothetical protein